MKNIVRLAVVCLLFSLPAAAQWDWSSPGSGGVVDPNGPVAWDLTGTTLSIRPDWIGSAEVRYPVTNTVGSSFDITPPWTTLSITASDNSATAASVSATLYQVEKCSDQQVALCTVTSTDGDGTPACDVCTFSGGLDFANNAYYVLVTASKTDLGGVAALHAVAVY
ncbi:MAG TPA: hypothetical protein VFN10_22250 [Thermoanaerobaculia bacterium]|nr:hypothetical protein [Thermoanaerobaculia bacterium]